MNSVVSFFRPSLGNSRHLTSSSWEMTKGGYQTGKHKNEVQTGKQDIKIQENVSAAHRFIPFPFIHIQQ
jgi:hypothetical protein